jgi:hypothetical protein
MQNEKAGTMTFRVGENVTVLVMDYGFCA